MVNKFQELPSENGALHENFESSPQQPYQYPQHDPHFTPNEQPHYPEGFPQPPHPPPLPDLPTDLANIGVVHKPRQSPSQPHSFLLQGILPLPFLRPDPYQINRADSNIATTSSYLPEIHPPFLSQITSGLKSITSVFERMFRRR